MTPAATPDDFLRAPAGTYYIGRCFAFWQQSRELDGLAIWGHPDADSLRVVVRLLEVGTRAPHRSLLDMRGLTGVDFEGFDVMYRGVRDHQERFAKNIEMQAILRPEGPIGALVLGFYNLIPVRYPVKQFTNEDDALVWLEIAHRGDVLAELADMRETAFGRPELVTRLRARLAATNGHGSPEQLAKALGLSLRSLQRKLSDFGTTVRDEVHAFRVERAKKLLLEADDSLLAVATAVGFESVRTFSEIFGKRTGETPQTFRVRARSARDNGV